MGRHSRQHNKEKNSGLSSGNLAVDSLIATLDSRLHDRYPYMVFRWRE